MSPPAAPGPDPPPLRPRTVALAGLAYLEAAATVDVLDPRGGEPRLRRQPVGDHPPVGEARQDALDVGIVETDDRLTEERHPAGEVGKGVADLVEVAVGVT